MSELVEHLRRQVVSSQRLLEVVLDQARAVRARDIDRVLETLSQIQTEMLQRARLEEERSALIARAAVMLDRPAAEVDLDALLTLEPSAVAAPARALSAELQGLLAETSRTHDTNRVLIRQELSFLDHLMRTLSGTVRTGYSPKGTARGPQLVNAVNARA